MFKIKLRFISWFHKLFPAKYCWGDCVAWAYDHKRFNPFKIESAEGCKEESKTHSTNMCYCCGWENGKCWEKLPKEEKEKRQAEIHNSIVDDIPF